MVSFMLDHASSHTTRSELERLSLPIKTADINFWRPWYTTPYVWNTQASFPIIDGCISQESQLGIDNDRKRHWIVTVLNTYHEQPQIFVHLRTS